MNMKPYRWDAVIYKGATFRDFRIWKTGDTVDTAVPVDLTGCEARMYVRDETTGQKLLELTTDNGGIILGGDTGKIERYISDADTTAMTWDCGIYDLEVVLTNGDVRRLFYGRMKTSGEQTYG